MKENALCPEHENEKNVIHCIEWLIKCTHTQYCYNKERLGFMDTFRTHKMMRNGMYYILSVIVASKSHIERNQQQK